MAVEVPFLELDGVEIANGYRTLSYLQKLGSAQWDIQLLGCNVLTREAAAPVSGVFVSPTADAAPWYDATVAESADFMGVYATDIQWANMNWSRSQAQRGGALGGTNIGPAMRQGRAVVVKGLLTAISAQGLEYGRQWLQEKLLGSSACASMTARLRDACPPTDGSNDARGEWTLYDVACVSGVDSPGDLSYKCADYEEITFTLVSSLPEKYARKATVTALSAMPVTRVMGPPPPGTVTDTFTRANAGPPPSASWTSRIAPSDNATNLVVSSNTLKANTGLIGPAWWNAGTMGRDHAVSVLIATADNANGILQIFGRLQSPGTAQVSGFMAQVFCNGTTTNCRIYSCQDGSAIFKAASQLHGTTLTLTAGDRIALVCRGPAVECWHVRPSTGVATRLACVYDDVNGSTQLSVAFYGGLAIGSSTLALTNFTETGIASQASFELPTMDPIAVDLGAPKIGSRGLVLTLDNTLELYQAIKGLRVVRKAATPAQIRFSDDFTTNQLATKYLKRVGPTTPYNVTGGQLKPLAAALATEVFEVWSQDATLNGIRPAQRMMARMDFHTGASLTAGQWGVVIATGEDGYLLANLLGAGTFRLSTIIPGGTEIVGIQKTGLTLTANTTYTIVAEKEYQGRAAAWLCTAGGDVIANLFFGTPNGFFNVTAAPYWGAGWRAVAVGTDEFYDNFFAADVAPEAATLNVQQLPAQDTVVLDSSRHAATWSDYNPLDGTTTVRDGSGVLQLNTWTGSLAGPQFGWQETNGEQETSLIIPYQAGQSVDQPPKYLVETQARRA